MKEKSNHLKYILNAIAIALVVPLLIFASQTSSLAVQPSVAAGHSHTVGLKSDSTVVAVGGNNNGQLNVGSWTGIEQVAAGQLHTVGVKTDGTVVAVGWNRFDQINVGSW
jgi:alpha-tubulin suppressor-like RCC1 family protein